MPADDQTPSERLAAQFYAWERRGRGWQIWPYPVDIEPPFRPFVGHWLPAVTSHDDGRIPTLGSTIADFFRGRKPEALVPADETPWYELEPEVEPVDDGEALVPFGVTLPADVKIAHAVADQFLSSLIHAQHPVGFEIVGTAAATRMQVICRASDSQHAAAGIRNHFPEAVLSGDFDALVSAFPDAAAATPSIVVDFGLSEEFMFPLRRAKSFDPDPLILVAAAMEDLREDEVGVYQVLFRHARHPWAESILRAVSDGDGKAFFADAPQMIGHAREKAGRPLVAVILRVAAVSPDSDRVLEIARRIASVIANAKEPLSNSLIPLSNDGYPDEEHWSDLVGRTGRRAGMLLNVDELLTFTHLPSASVRSPKLVRYTKKTKAAPAAASHTGVLLGVNDHQGTQCEVRVDPGKRLRHTYVIGASGTGKSNLLLSMIAQDIEAGEGIGLLDPHGDLADEVLARVPESRLKDVILFDPSDEECPIAWNILQAHSPLEKTLLSSDIVATFKRLSTSWGDQMTSVLGNAVLAILESTRGGSIGDLRRFLVDPDWRKEFLKSVTDPEIVFYWQKEFPLLTGRPQASVLTRLDTFLRPRPVRAMVTARKDRLDFRAVIDERKIFIGKLAQGAIGEENSSLLGSLLVSKFHQVALSRQDAGAAARSHFYLYIDEFHSFITPTMASLLSGARKYRLGLTLAHQDLRQLTSRDQDVAAAVIANPCTRICFRVGEADARLLKESFSYFDGKDLQNLGVGEAIVRMERSEWDFNLRTARVAEVVPEVAAGRRDAALAFSRANYGVTPEAAPPATVPAAEVQEAATTAPEDRPPAAPRTRKAAAASADPVTSVPAAATTDLGGRGGAQHKYLQDLIRRWAEGRGYRVSIERPVLDGLGTIDVVIEKEGRTPIACEISVTTSADHELENAQKCFAAGFDDVFLVAPDQETLAKVRERAAKTLQPRLMKRLRFVLPEQVFSAVSVLEGRSDAPSTPAPAGDAEVLTAKQVEELLKIDVKTIYRYVQKGMMPYVRVQSNLRFIRSEVLSWFREHGSGGGPPKKK